MKIEYTPPETTSKVEYALDVNNDVIDRDIDDVDYSKYAEDDSDEEMAIKLGY